MIGLKIFGVNGVLKVGEADGRQAPGPADGTAPAALTERATVHRECAYAISAIAVLAGGLTACDRGAEIETMIEFDGERRTISTTDVACIRQLDGSLVILVSERPRHTVRIHLSQRGQIAVLKAGLRYEELTGFVADPAEMTGTKIDDTYTVRGRMPPKENESDWHTFTIETTCPGYSNAVPSNTVPNIGAP